MKRCFALLLSAILLMSCAACGAPASQAAPAPAPAPTEPVATVPETTAATAPAATVAEAAEVVPQETVNKDDLPYTTTSSSGLVTITLPNPRWVELYTDEHTILFSDGDCAITIDLFKNTATMPSVPFSDEHHKLIFTSTLSANDYVLFITGYAHEEIDFSAVAGAISSIRIDKSKVPAAVAPEPKPTYTIQDTNYTAWVTANALNVRAASGTDATILTSLSKDTKVTVTGNVLADGQYIGWSRVKLSNGTVGFVSSQYLTTTQPAARPQRTGSSLKLYSSRGTVYTLYEYSDGKWRDDNSTIYWCTSDTTWENSAGKILYTYDPTYVPSTKPTKTGASMKLWSSSGNVTWVYEYTDYTWRNDSGVAFWPDGFSTWKNENGRIYYDYDPTETPVEPTDPPEPPSGWKSDFENALWAHDGARACWYTYLGDGYYEVYCENADDPSINGYVYVNAYTGAWQWA